MVQLHELLCKFGVNISIKTIMLEITVNLLYDGVFIINLNQTIFSCIMLLQEENPLPDLKVN